MKKNNRFYQEIINNTKGFTLFELMVVMVIIAILVAIAIPIYGEITDKVEQRACQANLRSLDGAANQYRMDHGVYPATYEDLENPDYFVRVPACPTTGNDYNYNPVSGRFSCDTPGHFYPSD